jgi:hypothetical protein
MYNLYSSLAHKSDSPTGATQFVVSQTMFVPVIPVLIEKRLIRKRKIFGSSLPLLDKISK